MTPRIEIKPKMINRERKTIVTSSFAFFLVPFIPTNIGINTLLN